MAAWRIEGSVEKVAQLGEGIGVVTAKGPEQLVILLEAEGWTDHFDGQDLAVRQLRRKAALPDMVKVGRPQLVIDEAKDGRHRTSQGHGASP